METDEKNIKKQKAKGNQKKPVTPKKMENPEKNIKKQKAKGNQKKQVTPKKMENPEKNIKKQNAKGNQKKPVTPKKMENPEKNIKKQNAKGNQKKPVTPKKMENPEKKLKKQKTIGNQKKPLQGNKMQIDKKVGIKRKGNSTEERPLKSKKMEIAPVGNGNAISLGPLKKTQKQKETRSGYQKSVSKSNQLPNPETSKRKAFINKKKKQFQSKGKSSKEDKCIPDELLNKEKELSLYLFGGLDLTQAEEKKGDKTEVEKNVQRHKNVADSLDIENETGDPVKKPVWVDDDDENIRVKDVVATYTKARGSRKDQETSNEKYLSTLQAKFTRVMGDTPEWARLDRKMEDEDDDELSRTTGNYLSSDVPADLPKSLLDYNKLYHLNRTTYAEGGNIKAVDFNPKHQIGLVAGNHGRKGSASLFQVDGESNHHIQTIKFDQFPIVRGKFMMDGRRFLMRSHLFNYFYMYDMEAGKESKIPSVLSKKRASNKDVVVSPNGEIVVFLTDGAEMPVYEAKTLTHIHTFLSPEVVQSATFNSDGSKMYACGFGGNVTVWDMKRRACVHVFYDDGSIEGTSITLSPSDQYLACGSSSGIVNIYDTADLTNSVPMPVKSLGKLLTSVTSLEFNPSSEILATVSEVKENSMKLVHFPSMTYFQNFPHPSADLSNIHIHRFSPRGGYLAIGNNKGTAHLYRLNHYHSY